MIIFLLEFTKLLIYFIFCATCAFTLRKIIKIDDELYRKLLHFILLGSSPVFLYVFSTWYSSVLASASFAILAYPLLSFAEKLDGYKYILAERDIGEIKRSLIAVFGMFAIVIAICWGLLGTKYLALAVILGWGLGDAAAALVGKKFGKHHLKGKFIDGKKTLEGTIAMFIVSFIAIITVLILNSGLSWYGNMLISIIAAGVCSIAELNTKNGLDTLTCPAATLAAMLSFLHLWGGAL